MTRPSDAIDTGPFSSHGFATDTRPSGPLRRTSPPSAERRGRTRRRLKIERQENFQLVERSSIGGKYPEPAPLVYDALRDSGQEIRLLSFTSNDPNSPISVSLQPFEITTAPPYVALSYVWGESGNPLQSRIFVNNHTFSIQPRCIHALRKLRRNKLSTFYWVDAICINQADPVEKGPQVQLMAKIFANAQMVAACYGPVSARTSAMMERLRKAVQVMDELDRITLLPSEPGDGIYPPSWRTSYMSLRRSFPPWLDLLQTSHHIPSEASHQVQNAVGDALDEVARSSYWERLWIVQELALARKRVLLNDTNCIDIDIIENEGKYLSQPDWSNMDALFKFIIDRDHGMTFGLGDLIFRFQNRRCSDPRDRLYGMLSLAASASAGYTIIPDYTIPIDLLAEDILVKWSKARGETAVVEHAATLSAALLPPFGLTRFESELVARHASLQPKAYRGAATRPLNKALNVHVDTAYVLSGHGSYATYRYTDGDVFPLLRASTHDSLDSDGRLWLHVNDGRLVRAVVFKTLQAGDTLYNLRTNLHMHTFGPLLITRPLADSYAVLGFGIECPFMAAPGQTSLHCDWPIAVVDEFGTSLQVSATDMLSLARWRQELQRVLGDAAGVHERPGPTLCRAIWPGRAIPRHKAVRRMHSRLSCIPSPTSDSSLHLEQLFIEDHPRSPPRSTDADGMEVSRSHLKSDDGDDSLTA